MGRMEAGVKGLRPKGSGQRGQHEETGEMIRVVLNRRHVDREERRDHA